MIERSVLAAASADNQQRSCGCETPRNEQLLLATGVCLFAAGWQFPISFDVTVPFACVVLRRPASSGVVRRQK